MTVTTKPARAMTESAPVDPLFPLESQETEESDLLLTDTRDLAVRMAADWCSDMGGQHGDLYRGGFLTGFRVGYAEAEKAQGGCDDG